MEFSELQDATLSTRFKESQRDDAKRWLRMIYAETWAVAPWPWKLMPSPAQLTIPAGAQATDFTALQTIGRITKVMVGPTGREIPVLSEDDFDVLHVPRLAASQRGSIDACTPVASEDPDYGPMGLSVTPLPTSSTTLYVRGYLRVWRYAADVRTFGNLQSDTDKPAWDSAHHEFLAYGAGAIGLREENDPTWMDLRSVYDSGLGALVADSAPTTRMQYGRQTP